MNQDFLTALERTEKPSRIRKEGFVPGIIYGKSLEKPLPVMFEMNKLRSALDSNTKNAITKVKVGNDIKHCIMKGLQRDSRTGKIIHIDFQAAAANDIIRLKIPIIYIGREWLENKGLILEILFHEVEVAGKADDLPAMVEVNLEGKHFGDKIIVSDIKIYNGIDIVTAANEMIAVITIAKKADEETEKEA